MAVDFAEVGQCPPSKNDVGPCKGGTTNLEPDVDGRFEGGVKREEISRQVGYNL